MTETTLAVQMIAIDLLQDALWNARKSFDPAALEELAATIRKGGVHTPLLIRPLRTGGDGEHYEIIAGHRRKAAALLAGENELPCIVRELTDDEARVIGLVDNAQRVDVPALEVADAYAELRIWLGTAAAIALRVGKDVSYVARHLQLTSLAEMPRKALAERLITVDHALLLARLGVEEQGANLKWCLDNGAGIKVPVAKVIADRIEARAGKQSGRFAWEPQSPQRLKEHIEQNVGRKLSRAPWDLEDATLAGAVACTACPSNTKANDTLFGDLNISAATCEDGGCFERKREAFVQICLQTIPKKSYRTTPPPGLNGVNRYIHPLRVSWKTTSVMPRPQRKGFEADRDGFAPEQVFKTGQWVEAKAKSCAHVRLGVTVDWSDDAFRGYMGDGSKPRKPGQILSVCIAAKCKAHPKAWEKAAKTGNGSAAADEARQQKLRQLEVAYEKYEPAVRESIFDAIVAKLDPLKSLLLVNDSDDDSPGCRKELLKSQPGLSGWQLEALVSFANRFAGAQNVNGYWMAAQGVANDREALWSLAKKTGVDADKLAAAALPADVPDEVRAKLAPVAAPKKAAKPAPVKKSAKPPAKKAAKKNVAKKTAKKGGK